MIRCLTFIVAMICTHELPAQFMNLQISVEPELTATIERDLSFGEVITNSGIAEIRLGDLNMGVFSIRSLSNYTIDIELIHPEALLSTDERYSDTIPLDLSVAYSYSQNYNQDDTFMMPDNRESINISPNNDISANNWNTIYLFVYGTINVGDIANGVYEGESVLQVTYY